jgi:hypothetical protein
MISLVSRPSGNIQVQSISVIFMTVVAKSEKRLDGVTDDAVKATIRVLTFIRFVSRGSLVSLV